MYLLGVSSSSVSSGYNMIIKIFPEYLILVVKMLCCNYFSLTWWINPLPTCISKAKQFVFIPEVISLSYNSSSSNTFLHLFLFNVENFPTSTSILKLFHRSRTTRNKNFNPVWTPSKHYNHRRSIWFYFSEFMGQSTMTRCFIYVVIYSGSLGWWVRGRVLEWTVLYFILESTLTFLKIHLLISVAWGDAAFIICC